MYAEFYADAAAAFPGNVVSVRLARGDVRSAVMTEAKDAAEFTDAGRKQVKVRNLTLDGSNLGPGRPQVGERIEVTEPNAAPVAARIDEARFTGPEGDCLCRLTVVMDP